MYMYTCTVWIYHVHVHMISGDRHMTVVHILVAGQVWVLSTECLLSAFSVSVVMCAVFVYKRMHCSK